MKSLMVLYDAGCGFCISCRHWLEQQPKLLRLEFVPARSAAAARLFPQLAAEEDELIVVSDEGGVYRGAKAWLLCLYALADYREWSLRLSRPVLLPLARRAFELVSRNRKGLSRILGRRPDEELAKILRSLPSSSCAVPRPGIPGSC